uniref:Uncharacterized protein n=1 Tax=Anguilla anguilla TaxID=7936 RepID=A0A0E9VHH8_ANGAN
MMFCSFYISPFCQTEEGSAKKGF